MSNLVILKLGFIKYQTKFEKKAFSFRSEISIFDIFLKYCTKKVLKIYKSVVIENLKPVLLCSTKWRPLQVFVKLHESSLLITNIVKGTVSGPRQFLATASP